MKRAGLPLSVGQAPLAMRVLLALVFAVAAALCIGGGIVLSSNPVARAIAILLIVPVGLIGILAVAFVLAPHSRYGDWLDRFVPRLAEPKIAVLVTVLLWVIAFVLTANR
jgi:hypothetical protein